MMRKFLVVLLILYCSSLFAETNFYYSPNWEYINIENTQIIYDKAYEKRAKLVASFLQYVVLYEPEMRQFLKSETIIIDAKFMSENLNFNLYNFVQNSFRQQHRTKLDYDPISLNNLQQLTDIPLSFNFNVFKKDILQYTYNLTRGKTLQGTKKVLYPEWFENPTEENQSLDLLEAFERRIKLNSYDNYRDFALNNRNFTVNQLLNNSYLRKQPSNIYLGVLAQDYFMLEFGLDKWEKIVKDVEYFDKIFFPYSSAFKKNTGITLSQFYRKTHQYYKERFETDIASFPPDISKPLFKHDLITKNRSYTHPYILNNMDVIALYSSFEEPPMIVRIDRNKNIHSLTEFGFSSSEKITVNEPFVIWSQNYAEPSFFNFSNSRIAIYNLNTDTTMYLGENGFFLEPALSPKHEILSVVSYNADFEQNILLLNFPSGEVIKTINNPDYFSYYDLTWLNQNELLYIVENFLGQTAIYKYNINTNKELRITPFTIDPIKDLTTVDHEIFFSYPVNDVFNICYLNMNDKQAYQTFYPEVSARQATIKDTSMVYVSNRYWGDQLRTIILNKDFWTPIIWNDYQDVSAVGAEILKLDENTNFYPVELDPFYKLINFKRLRFSYDQREAFIYSISQNPMKTFTIHAKTLFNFSNQGVKTTVSNIISKHYPNILSEISHANANFTVDRFEEVTYGSSIKLPYYFGVNSYSGNLNTNIGIYHLDRYKSRSIDNFLHSTDFNMNYVKTDLSFNFSKIRAKNHFYSPFGQNYLFSYKKSISNDNAQQFYAMADYSFAGLRKSDSILLENAFLYEDNSNRYLFGNMISNVYGYTDYPRADRVYKTTFKYYLPLAYPEKGIDNAIFLKRIYTSFFGTYAKTILDHPDKASIREQNAIGNELIFDYNILDSIEFQIGFRYSYTLNKASKHQFDFYIPFTKF